MGEFFSRYLSVGVVISIFAFQGCGSKPKDAEPGITRSPLEGILTEQERSRFTHCVAKSDGSYSDEIFTIDGSDSDKGFDWAEGGGCVKRNFREVWAVLLNHELIRWNKTNSADVEKKNDSRPSKSSIFYSIKYKAGKIIIVDWIMDWVHGLRTGSLEQPESVVVNYGKVSGTKHITYWKGSIWFDKVSDSITNVSIRNEIEAAQTNSKDAAGAIKDVVTKLREGTPAWDELNAAKSYL